MGSVHDRHGIFHVKFISKAEIRKEDTKVKRILVYINMGFFTSAINTLRVVTTALGAGVSVWGLINLLEGYGNDNPGAKSQGVKHVIPNSLEQ